MIFKRRKRLGFWQRMREIAAPRKGWRRGFRYIGKRVQRLPDTPHRIALGFACGAFASFTPFFTLHALVAIAAAYALRANIIASVFGTIVGNPLSFPLIAAICMNVGNWVLGRTDGVADLDNLSFAYVIDHPLEFLEGIFTPYFIGGLGPGLICAVAFYVLLKPAISGFQRRRRDVLAARARALIEARGQEIQRRARVAAAGPDDDAGGSSSDDRQRRARSGKSVGDALAAELANRAEPRSRLSAPQIAEGPGAEAGKSSALRSAASATASGAADIVQALRKADPRLAKRPRSAG